MLMVIIPADVMYSSNMLYPREDRMTNTLMYFCKSCSYVEVANSACIFQNKLNSVVGDTAGVTTDVGSDPTVGLSDFCTLCGEQLLCGFCGEASISGAVKEVDDKEEGCEVEKESFRASRGCKVS